MRTVNFKDIIIYEDENFILVNKPPFVSSLDERAAESVVPINRLAIEYWPDAQLCHRLDKETSGVLAIAKNSEAYRCMAMQFEHREVNKVYHAVIEGIREFNDELVDLPVYSTSHGTVKIDERGKSAQTSFKTIKAYNKHTLVECRPATGRLHQIRVHLWALKAPIAGDITYGGHPFYLSQIKKRYNLKSETEELPIMQRVALHAYGLEFKTLNGEIISIQAPYPKDFTVLLKQLEKYS